MLDPIRRRAALLLASLAAVTAVVLGTGLGAQAASADTVVGTTAPTTATPAQIDPAVVAPAPADFSGGQFVATDWWW